jgi:enamine deaminase RidA (YjgF/YER057c/UK114 family)
LKVAGSSLDRLVKTRIFRANVEDFATVERIYELSFPILHQPAGASANMWFCPAAS